MGATTDATRDALMDKLGLDRESIFDAYGSATPAGVLAQTFYTALRNYERAVRNYEADLTAMGRWVAGELADRERGIEITLVNSNDRLSERAAIAAERWQTLELLAHILVAHGHGKDA